MLRAIASNVVALLRSHLELFAIELQEEKARVNRLSMLVLAAIVTGGTGFLFLNLTIVYVKSEDWRRPILLGLAVFYLIAFAVIYLVIRRRVSRAAMPFSETIYEFKKDRECLRRDD